MLYSCFRTQMETESSRETYDRVIKQWEEVWEGEWKETTSNRLEWRTLFSMIFEDERAEIYSKIFEERKLELREVLERGKTQVDIRSRGEEYLRYLYHLKKFYFCDTCFFENILNLFSRSLNIQWAKENDVMAILWKGTTEYDKHEYNLWCIEEGKERQKKRAKVDMNFMDTETDVLFELGKVKKGPTSPEDIDEAATTKVRKVQRKFRVAELKDENADRPFKRGWCEEHEDWCPIFSKCVPEDPLETSRGWLLNMRKGQESSMFYNQNSEEEMRLIFAEQSVDKFRTWQYKATQMLTSDMENIETHQLWPFTAYSPWPEQKSIAQGMEEISQEEMRYLMYEKKKIHREAEYIIFERNLLEKHKAIRNILKPGLSRSITAAYPHVPLEYFNLIVEGKEESLNCPALKCNMPVKGGALEHFILTNCPSCREKMEENTIKCSNEDRENEQVDNMAQIKISREEEVLKTNIAKKIDDGNSISDEEYYSDPPSEFECDIMHELMTDPVLLPSGHTVDRDNVTRHILNTPKNPFNEEYMTVDMLKPADELRIKISLWKTKQKKAAREEIVRKKEDKNVAPKDAEEYEDSSSEDADNPERPSQTEENKSEREDVRHSEWRRKYMANTTCNLCNEIFPSIRNKKMHDKRNHSEKLNHYTCPQCHKNYTNTTALNHHLAVLHGEKQQILFKGKVIEINSPRKYLDHKQFKRKRYLEKSPKCDECGIRIAREHLKRHYKEVQQQVLLKGNRKPVMLEKSTKNFKCDNCRKAFKREEHLIQHISEVHIGPDKFSCMYCEKTFKRKHHLNVHNLNNHSPFFTKFECHICQTNFIGKHTRDRHMQEVHEDNKHKCIQCKKTFTQKSDKARHMKEVHEANEKNYKCPSCEKKFARKFVQTRHTKTCNANTVT